VENARPRPVRPEDRPEYLRMRLALYPEHSCVLVERELDEYLESTEPSASRAVLVIDRREGGLCAFGEFFVDESEDTVPAKCGNVGSYYVDQELRRMGLGSALLAAGEAWARGNGYQYMTSDCDSENLASHRAHLANGFQESHRTTHFIRRIPDEAKADGDS